MDNLFTNGIETWNNKDVVLSTNDQNMMSNREKKNYKKPDKYNQKETTGISVIYNEERRSGESNT